jgi:hypothetical protein
MAHNCRRHTADRSRTGDQHIFAKHVKVRAVCIALPNGSKIAATSGFTPGCGATRSSSAR